MPTRPLQTFQNGVLVNTTLIDVSQEELNAESLFVKAKQAIIDAETANANWATLTAQQKDEALRRTMVAVAKIIRLVLSQLDSD